MGAMTRTDQILAMLREREHILAERERELAEELGAIRDDLRRARAAITVLDPETPPAHQDAPARGLTLTEATYNVLRQAGRPLHIRDIIEALRSRGIHPTLEYERFRDNLTGTIGRKARKKKVFAALGEGMYGLQEWKQTVPGDSNAPSGPTEGRARNTDIVVQYVDANPGQTRRDVINATEGLIETSGDPRKVASTVVGQMVQRGRLVENEGKLYTSGWQQLLLVSNGGTTAA